MRSFLAISLSNELRKTIADFMKCLPKICGVKLVPPENLHLTLEFLGEIDEKKRRDLLFAMDKIAAASVPFKLQVRGVGAFPKKTAPRVFWLGVEAPPALTHLAKEIKTAVAVGNNKPFSPHLTIGRVKFEDTDFRKFSDRFFKEPTLDFGAMEVVSFSLMKSDLSRGAPVYTELECFPLAGKR